MPYRNRNYLRPVNTLKHVVDRQDTIASGNDIDAVLVQGAENAASTSAFDVDIGAHVRSIFLNVQVVNETDATGLINNAYMYVYANPGNNVSPGNIPPVNEVGTSDFRKNVFHQEMVMF